MHLPVSGEEISTFLEIPLAEVEHLWQAGLIKRSMYHSGRISSALAHSSVFDVLEYGIASGALMVQVTTDVAAMWVTYLCEISEWDEWDGWGVEERAVQLLAYAVEDGLCDTGDLTAARIAAILVFSQMSMVSLCLENDEREELCYA